jgi:hypothetical protein
MFTLDIGRRLRRLAAPAVAMIALVPAANSCDTQQPGGALGPLVTITYEQSGACALYKDVATDTQPHGGLGPHTAYVMFRIVSIDNTASGAHDFQFDPSRLYLNTDPRQFADPTLRVWTLDSFATYSQTIRGGLAVQMTGGYLYVVVDTDSADGVGEASKTSYTLYHDTAAGSPGVILTKKDASRTQWPRTDSCDDIRARFK